MRSLGGCSEEWEAGGEKQRAQENRRGWLRKEHSQKEENKQGQMLGTQTGKEASRFGNEVITVTLSGAVLVEK